MLKNAVSYKETDGYLMPKGSGHLTQSSRNAAFDQVVAPA